MNDRPISFRTKTLTLAMTLAAGSTGSGSALAQDDNILETIFVTSDRRAIATEDIAASVSAIDSSTLETFKHVHIGEVLNTVPGVVFNRGNGQESLIGIRSPVLTGAGSCGAFQFAQDGIPLRGVGFCNVNELFEANSEQAGAIEIVRGPGSVLFGVNALHGAINVISPTLADEAGGDVSIDVGPHDYGRVNATYNSGGDRNAFGAWFNGATDGGYKDDSGFDQQKLNLSHRYDNGDIKVTTVLAATNLNQETAGYLEGFEAYKDDSLKKVNGNPEAFRDARSFRLHSRIEGEGGRGNWMVTPYYRDTDMDFLMHFLPGTPLEQNGHESVGVQSMYHVVDGMIDWTVGLDGEYTDGYLKQSQDGGFGPFPSGKQYDYDVKATMFSPYVLAKFQTTDNDQLSLGFRYENLEYKYDNKMIDGNTAEDGTPCPGGCRYSRPSDRSDTFDNFTAHAGWIHDFTMYSQVYADVSYAFRAPQATELYRLQANQTVSDLDSEEIQSVEIGYRANRDRVSYGLSAYYMDKDNVIFQDSDRNNVSGGKTRHKGIELNTIVRMTDTLTLNVVGSYARHKYRSNIAPLGTTILLDGKDMDTAPKLTGNVQLNWQATPQSHVNLEWQHMGPYYTDEQNLHKYEGHDLLNLRYQYDSANNWYFAARVTNLLDTDYAERADYSGFGGDRYFVGEPASVYFTLGSKF